MMSQWLQLPAPGQSIWSRRWEKKNRWGIWWNILVKLANIFFFDLCRWLLLWLVMTSRLVDWKWWDADSDETDRVDNCHYNHRGECIERWVIPTWLKVIRAITFFYRKTRFMIPLWVSPVNPELLSKRSIFEDIFWTVLEMVALQV